MTEHYFTATPDSAMQTRQVQATLGGSQRTVLTANSVFSNTGLDKGTAVLLKLAPKPPKSGAILDIGCGWGAIALDAALQSPETEIWGIDVNERALELTAQNAARLGLNNIRAVTAEKVPTDLEFTEIRSNPPIRVGKQILHDLLQTWLPRLTVGGSAYLVVAKQLGAASLQKWLTDTFAGSHDIALYDRDKGFHIIAAHRIK
ncbi:MAG: methyltransferase [Microbacteriaceae bacterium]|nr:methyltransferase [Microbacteriaceae bacterium]